MKTVPVKGKTYGAVSVAITKETENWNEYTLADGAVLRLKVVVSEILRATDPPVLDDDGHPIYVVRTNNVVVLAAPPSDCSQR